MNRIIRNLLPQDTRSVEYPAAFSILLCGILMLADMVANTNIFNVHPLPFWVAFCFIIGGMQFYSVMLHPSMDVLRCAMNWVSGSFLIWLSFIDGVTLGSTATFALGVSNIAAFLINIIILSEKWK